MLRSIVALAKELGRKVSAEGVEAEDDIAFLRSIGCEYAQGAYYGELMADRDVSQLLKVVRRAERRQRKAARLFRQGAARPRPEPAAEAPPVAALPAPVAIPPPAAARPAAGGRPMAMPRPMAGPQPIVVAGGARQPPAAPITPRGPAPPGPPHAVPPGVPAGAPSPPP